MKYRKAMDILRAADVYAPAVVQYDGGFHIFSQTELVASGPSIAEALERGGFLPPAPRNPNKPLFVAAGFNVIYGEETICTCRSNTMAKRIANALNEYVPGDRRS